MFNPEVQLGADNTIRLSNDLPEYVGIFAKDIRLDDARPSSLYDRATLSEEVQAPFPSPLTLAIANIYVVKFAVQCSHCTVPLEETFYAQLRNRRPSPSNSG